MKDFSSKAKHKITIQSKDTSLDSDGWNESSLNDLNEVWAIIETLSGKEVFESQQIQSRCTHKITIRYQDTLSNTRESGSFRIKYGTRVMNIRYVQNLDWDMKLDGKVYQILTVEENVSGV